MKVKVSVKNSEGIHQLDHSIMTTVDCVICLNILYMYLIAITQNYFLKNGLVNRCRWTKMTF